MSSATVLPIAAIVYNPEIDVDALMAEAARQLSARGVRIGGVVQYEVPGPPGDPCGMALEDLESGERFALSQELGSGSEACRLDTAALAQAGAVLRGAMERGVDLLIVNKFGGQEVFGAGLRAEIGLAASNGVPLLTAVGERFLDDWRAFTGNAGQLLPAELEAVLAWWAELPPRG